MDEVIEFSYIEYIKKLGNDGNIELHKMAREFDRHIDKYNTESMAYSSGLDVFGRRHMEDLKKKQKEIRENASAYRQVINAMKDMQEKGYEIQHDIEKAEKQIDKLERIELI